MWAARARECRTEREGEDRVFIVVFAFGLGVGRCSGWMQHGRALRRLGW